MKQHRGKQVLLDIWPFLPSIFDYGDGRAAWPHEKGKGAGPLLAYFLWEDESEDRFWVHTMEAALRHVRNAAIAEGCTDSTLPIYSNCSLSDTLSGSDQVPFVPVEDIYRQNLVWLSKVKSKYDPDDVMGRTGGFKIPPKT